MSNIDKTCTTHHICHCIQERLDRIEAVWQKYKHMDEILTTGNQIAFLKDKIAINVLYDLWQAIRRKE